MFDTLFKRIFAVVFGALALITVGLMAFSRLPSQAPVQDVQFGHGGPLESINYVAAIGSAASPATLTTSYNGASSTPILAVGLPNITIAGTYTPRSYGSQMFLLIERSIDNGATYQPYTVLEPRATDVLIYSNGTGTSAGIPFTFPSSQAFSASGTSIGFSFDISLVADYLRFSIKESTTSTAGRASLRSVLTNN